MPNHRLKFQRLENDTLRVIFCGENVANIEIEPNTIFEDIKKPLDCINRLTSPQDCDICGESNDTNKGTPSVACSHCGFTHCVKCLVNIIKTNKGVSKCPQCRAESGQPLPPALLDFKLSQIYDMIDEKERESLAHIDLKYKESHTSIFQGNINRGV
jgi:DNA-directed RNA polymerase subunit RPC12/RpoP